MTSRNYFAWSMADAATNQDNRNTLMAMRSQFRENFDPLSDLPDKEFKNQYRLTKNAFFHLCDDLRHLSDLKSTQRTSLETKVLTALFFYASGSYQRPVGVAKHMGQTTCSQFINEVTKALIHPSMMGKYIKFPTTQLERQEISHKFYIKYGFPGVIGCIDGSHFRIFCPPTEVEHIYFCRKQYHSINVQMVCDSEYKILSVNPKFGGANHDAFVWQNSDLNNYMQSLHATGEMVWLLGDSGYPLRPWLMTPISDAIAGSPQAYYNKKHCGARVVIENTFGRLKNRWRCLSKDRVLHYKPHKCAQIIEACCVLYNLGLSLGLPEADDDFSDEETRESLIYTEEIPTTELLRGRALRDQLVHRLN